MTWEVSVSASTLAWLVPTVVAALAVVAISAVIARCLIARLKTASQHDEVGRSVGRGGRADRGNHFHHHPDPAAMGQGRRVFPRMITGPSPSRIDSSCPIA
jgi:hypothetical protein